MSWTEDALSRFEEHRDEAGRLVRLFVHPKSGLPKYEILLGSNRQTKLQGVGGKTYKKETPRAQAPDQMVNQAVWEITKF